MRGIRSKREKKYNPPNGNKRDNGYKLIQSLKQNPEKFCFIEQLFEEYDHYGLDLSSLAELLQDKNDRIRWIAVYICHDLGSVAWDELSDYIIPLLNDKDIRIVKYALKMSAYYPYRKNCLIAFNYLNHSEQVIRLMAMEILASYRTFTLKYMLEYFSDKAETIYQEYVSILLSADKLSEDEINNLINCDNQIKQKLAIIIACKYPEKFAQIIQQDFKDDDINQYILNKMK